MVSAGSCVELWLRKTRRRSWGVVFFALAALSGFLCFVDEPHVLVRGQERECFATVAALNDFGSVQCFLASLARFREGRRVFLLVVERRERLSAVPQLPQFVEVLSVEDLRLEPAMLLMYRREELASTVKPFLFRQLFEDQLCDSIVFMDPDMGVYASLGWVFEKLRQGLSSVLVTRHVSHPVPLDGEQPSSVRIMMSGPWNGGFIALQKGAAVSDFLEDWSKLCSVYGLYRVEQGQLGDQPPLAMACSMHDVCRPLREPSVNVAYWNIGESERQLYRAPDGVWRLKSGPRLTTFHFSGLGVEEAEGFSRHQSRLPRDGTATLHLLPLFEGRVKCLKRYPRRDLGAWSLGSFSDGTAIPDAFREFVVALAQNGALPKHIGAGDYRQVLTGDPERVTFVQWALEDAFAHTPFPKCCPVILLFLVHQGASLSSLPVVSHVNLTQLGLTGPDFGRMNTTCAVAKTRQLGRRMKTLGVNLVGRKTLAGCYERALVEAGIPFVHYPPQYDVTIIVGEFQRSFVLYSGEFWRGRYIVADAKFPHPELADEVWKCPKSGTDIRRRLERIVTEKLGRS